MVSTGGLASLLHATEPDTFDPVAFFSGRTESSGTLNEVIGSPKATRVSSVGSMRVDRVFVMDQVVAIEGDPTQRRQWQLRQTAPGRFTGTISDARGAVTGVVTGNSMEISYTMTNGMKVVQVLTMAADGKTVRNMMRISRFGIRVATLEETIRKI